MKAKLHWLHLPQAERVARVSCSVAVLVTSLAVVTVPTRAARIKIKLPAITFSGLPRYFATFKKEFEEVVIPGRPDTEIGALLSDAVPEKHRHLLRNLDLSNHTEAMKILQEEFGKPEHVMNYVVSELCKLKLVTSDKLFVEFVENIEKI